MVVFCDVWGIWWWRLTVSNARADSLRVPETLLPTARDVTNLWSGRDLAMLRQQHLDRGIPNEVPMELLVCDDMTRVRRQHVRLHQWNGVVVWGSLCRAGSGDLVCSPEFCFLQVCRDVRRIIPEKLSNRLYAIILIELGCELCGTYSKQNTARGYKKRSYSLSSTSSLLAFMGRMAFCSGARRVRQVLPWVMDGLASPMETVLYMLLCLPRSWGGLEVPRPIANMRIDVPPWLAGRTSKRCVYPDLFWPECGLAVEYDSDESHTDREREDQERRELLQDMGHVVVVFHADDIMNKEKFDAKVASIAGHLGFSLPPASPEFDALQQKLRDMLLRHRRWV